MRHGGPLKRKTPMKRSGWLKRSAVSWAQRRKGLEARAPGPLLTPEIKRSILERDGHCLKCKSRERLVVDHIKPLCNGGSNELTNLQTLCWWCNASKGTAVIDYRPSATPDEGPEPKEHNDE